MAKRRASRAFIIHGQDSEAVNEVARFLRSMDIDILSFHQAGQSTGQFRMILGNVMKGLEKSQVVIVLFTPDEQAVFYNPADGAYHGHPGSPKWEGWQSRPNVIFEAGMAIGIAGPKTIIAKLGPVREFSDLGGVDYVDLDRADAKVILQDRIRAIVRQRPRPVDELAGNFRGVSRRRWRYHGETDQIEKALNLRPYGSKRTLHTMVTSFAVETPDHEWNAERLARYIFERYDRGPGYTADSAFWYLVIFGVLTFKGINDWDEELWWANAVEHAIVTPRGLSLLHKLETLEGANAGI